MTDVIIIGGGLSGLASAVRLASKGLRVRLFERGARLGGRCYSYRDNTTGDTVDNGQHILLGAYHNLLEYLDIIGTRHLLSTQPDLRLPFCHPEKGFAEFRIKRLPKPFHLTAGMMAFPLLSLKDRMNIAGIGSEIQRFDAKAEERLKNQSVEQWLDDRGQSADAKKNFWYPIALSVMNETPDRASALLFARVLNKAFFGPKNDSAVLIPKVGQTDLYATNAVIYLRERNCEVSVKREVQSLLFENERVAGVRLTDGESVKAGAVISSIPSQRVFKILPDKLSATKPFAAFPLLDSSPIISFHLWFESAFTDIDYVGCIGLNLQWIFNRRKIFDENDKLPFYLTAVISGAREFIRMKKEDLVMMALNDIHRVFPDSRNIKLVHSVIIKEKKATFSATPLAESVRPNPETSVKGLFLAGDWTATGYPATIEGAVISGFRAAELVTNI